jgi:hypothetical protein
MTGLLNVLFFPNAWKDDGVLQWSGTHGHLSP